MNCIYATLQGNCLMKLKKEQSKINNKYNNVKKKCGLKISNQTNNNKRSFSLPY